MYQTEHLNPIFVSDGKQCHNALYSRSEPTKPVTVDFDVNYIIPKSASMMATPSFCLLKRIHTLHVHTEQKNNFIILVQTEIFLKM